MSDENEIRQSAIDFYGVEERAELREIIAEIMFREGKSAVYVDGKDTYTGPIACEKRIDIVMGLTGSESYAAAINPLSYKHNARIIDNFETMKYLPEYDGYNIGYLETESLMIADLICNKAMDRDENIVLSVIGNDLGSTMTTLRIFYNNDYDVYLHYNYLEPGIAASNTMNMLTNEGKFIDLSQTIFVYGSRPPKVYNHIVEAINKDPEIPDILKGYEVFSNRGEKDIEPYLLAGTEDISHDWRVYRHMDQRGPLPEDLETVIQHWNEEMIEWKEEEEADRQRIMDAWSPEEAQAYNRLMDMYRDEPLDRAYIDIDVFIYERQPSQLWWWE